MYQITIDLAISDRVVSQANDDSMGRKPTNYITSPTKYSPNIPLVPDVFLVITPDMTRNRYFSAMTLKLSGLCDNNLNTDMCNVWYATFRWINKFAYVFYKLVVVHAKP